MTTNTPTASLLWPRPQHLRALGASFRLGDGAITVDATGVDPGGLDLEGRLATTFAPRAVRLVDAIPAVVRLRIAPGPRGAESYRLRLGARGVELTAPSALGLYRGLTTLGQWIQLHTEADGARAPRFPGVEIEDWPELAVRGVLLDASRNRVPTLAHLEDLVGRLAAWKVNQLQLYTEHTFAYVGHEVVWRDWSPLDGADVRRLDDLCARHGIELVPNQNSFGHLHRWLVHEPYRRLAECPEGVEHPFSPFASGREPFSLCATDPRSLELLDDLYDQLLPSFRSGLFNVGLDETFDLGMGRSADACERLGKGRVYLSFLREVHARVTARGRRMQFWGDIILEHPELIDELPEDVVALAWGYEADHPFTEEAARFAASGREFHLCPGTSSWSSFAGRTENALANLAAAARAAAELGAAGVLITDWGDFGHLQPPSVSTLGLLAGAGFAWNRSAADEPLTLPFAELLDRHAFQAEQPGIGAVAVDLGSTYRLCGTPARNGSPLFHLLVFAHQDLGHPRYRGLSHETLEATLAHVEEQRRRIDRLEVGADSHVRIIARELGWAAAALDTACRLGLARLAAGTGAPLSAIPRPQRVEIAQRIGALAERLPELWLARSRPGGLPDSLAYLERPRRLLLD